MNRWIHFSLYFTIYDNLASFFFFLAYFRNDMGKGSFLLLNVKWNTLSLTGKELSAAFFVWFFFKSLFFKPCTHLTLTTRTCRGEVFKHFKRGWGWGVINFNRRGWLDVPGSISNGWEDWQGEGAVTFKLEVKSSFALFWHTKLDPEVRNSMKTSACCDRCVTILYCRATVHLPYTSQNCRSVFKRHSPPPIAAFHYF